MVLDNSKFSKFFNIVGISDANSGPFLIFIEYLSSKFLESHCTNPGINTIS